LLVLFGVAVGAFGTLVGVGGGFLVVPFLLLVYKLPPASAAATSLVVVFLNALSGTASYLRAKRVDVRTALLLSSATIPGALVGPFLATRIPARAFRIGFGAFLLAVAIFLMRRPERQGGSTAHHATGPWRIRRRFTDRDGATYEYTYSVPLALGISLVVGVLSSLLGIGGGIIHVPALIHLMSFPVHIATATSHFVLAVTSLVGVLGYQARGLIDWSLAAPIGAGVLAGAQAGAAISHRTKGRRIVQLLSLAVVVLALRVLWTGLR
jgi:uncharacterized membrane protein YfcA